MVNPSLTVSLAPFGVSSSASGIVQVGGGVHVVFPVLNSYSFTNSEQPSRLSSSFHSSYSGPNPFHLTRYWTLCSFLRPRLTVHFLTIASTSHSASESSAARTIGGGGG